MGIGSHRGQRLRLWTVPQRTRRWQSEGHKASFSTAKLPTVMLSLVTLCNAYFGFSELFFFFLNSMNFIIFIVL